MTPANPTQPSASAIIEMVTHVVRAWSGSFDRNAETEACRSACLSAVRRALDMAAAAAEPHPGERKNGYRQGREHAAAAIRALAYGVAR